MEYISKVVAPYFEVIYLDDNNRKHLAIARNIEEVRFIQNRFDTVTYKLVEK